MGVAAGRFVMFHPPLGASAIACAPQPPISVPTVVRPSVRLATINPAILHLQNPEFAGLGGSSQGSPRSSFQLPVLISPTGSPTDQTLFEEPQDATRKRYLPRYDIGSVQGASGLLKSVVLKPSQSGFQLIVDLADITDPSLASGHLRADATTRYILTGNRQGAAVSLDLAATNTDGTGLRLTLELPRLADRDSVYYLMTDQSAQTRLIIRRSLTVAFPAASLYQQATVVIDSPIPFTFDKDLDKNVFEQIVAPSGAQSAYVKRDLTWRENGYTYTYYLDSSFNQYGSQQCPFYFFPDSFKIARQPTPPHVPELIVSANGEDANSVTLTLSYVACPVWDPRRTDDAAAQLRQMFNLSSLPAPALFPASNTRLLLNLPSDDPSAAPALVPQPSAIIDMTAGIKAAVTLKLSQFEQVYQALFDNVSPLLSGRLEVTVGSDVHYVDFKAHAADFVGEILDIKTSVDQSNNLVVVLQNAIESTIHVERLNAVLTRNGQIDSNFTADISPALPVDLPPPDLTSPSAPGGALTVTFRLSPGSLLAGSLGSIVSSGVEPPSKDTLVKLAQSFLPTSPGVASAPGSAGPPAPVFDFSETSVVPDSKAIWRSVMRNQVVGPISRQIDFKLLASLLVPASTGASSSSASSGAAPGPATTPASAAAAPGSAVIAAQVVFENGQTATFDGSLNADAAGFLNQKVALKVPIEAYVLHEGRDDTYRYRVDLITKSGTKTGNFVSDNKDVVFLSLG